ncbi:MAG: nuclear transport factor 2 family protein [Alphaproteobacteria bacterium]|nr:nuclear transport factor 2 family protein [Alphaproteobacteria bacterium]
MTDVARNRETHARFAQAWAARDVKELLSCLTDDVVYSASVGPEPGATYRGKRDASDGFELIMAHDGSGTMKVTHTVFVADRAYAEWVHHGPLGEVRGIDLLVFRDGLIAVKDAYRKGRT